LEPAAAAGFVIGYVGPHAANAIDCVLVIDPDARAIANAVSGANRREYHVRGFNWVREVMPERLANAIVADIRAAREGDLAPSPPAMPGSRLRFEHGIEVGHTFKLGTRYSRPFGATFLDATGRPRELVMGSYGIGLDRAIAAVIETHHDADGIRWPMSIAPFEVIITVIDARDEDVLTASKRLHDQLTERGVEVLLDDRDERAGFKFKDADLIGVPLRITVGRKVLAEGAVELKERGGGGVERFTPGEAVEEACRRVQTARAAR
jgi:prolyl-tRNA synthetase